MYLYSLIITITRVLLSKNMIWINADALICYNTNYRLKTLGLRPIMYIFITSYLDCIMAWFQSFKWGGFNLLCREIRKHYIVQHKWFEIKFQSCSYLCIVSTTVKIIMCSNYHIATHMQQMWHFFSHKMYMYFLTCHICT